MYSTYFQAIPATHSEAQYQEWHHRCRAAEAALARQAAAGLVPDSETVAYFQGYVKGEITLGQAIGRVLDKLARTSHRTSL